MGEYTHNPITGLGFNDGASEGDGAAWEGGHKDMEGLKARSRHRVMGYGERTAPFDVAVNPEAGQGVRRGAVGRTRKCMVGRLCGGRMNNWNGERERAADLITWTTKIIVYIPNVSSPFRKTPWEASWRGAWGGSENTADT
jgi:hypothetical protein